MSESTGISERDPTESGDAESRDRGESVGSGATPPAGHVLELKADSHSGKDAIEILKALASEPRLRILLLLGNQVANVSEIAEALDLPMSTAVLHINALEEAGLIKPELLPGVRGLQKVCSRVYDRVHVELSRSAQPTEQSLSISMPVGAYRDFEVAPTCGMVSEEGIIGIFDDPAAFYEPDHVHAQLLWFRHGYVEYHFPNRLPPEARAEVLSLSLEICSEAPLHHKEWPSDITLWVNDVEVGTWTSPADFGGQRGALTPSWWETWNSQYGLLKVWQVNSEGSAVDGVRASDVRLDDLGITDRPYIAVRIGVKADARHPGGINIFGQKFGNYPQDIVLRVCYTYEE